MKNVINNGILATDCWMCLTSFVYYRYLPISKFILNRFERIPACITKIFLPHRTQCLWHSIGFYCRMVSLACCCKRHDVKLSHSLHANKTVIFQSLQGTEIRCSKPFAVVLASEIIDRKIPVWSLFSTLSTLI